MHVTPRRLPALAAALALLLATGAQAQLKLPGNGSGSGTGLKLGGVPSSAPAPAAEASAPAPAPAPARAAAPSKPAASVAATAPAASAAPSANAALNDKEAAASAAAAGWLTLLDRGDWGTAWETSAGMFRGSVPLDKWMEGIPRTRTNLGALVDRTPSNATYKTDFPGKPKGDYVTVLFVSRFEKRSVEEVVTAVLEPDGRWRVTGYGSR